MLATAKFELNDSKIVHPRPKKPLGHDMQIPLYISKIFKQLFIAEYLKQICKKSFKLVH